MLEGAGLLDSDVPTWRLDDYLDVKGLGSEWYRRREVCYKDPGVFPYGFAEESVEDHR